MPQIWICLGFLFINNFKICQNRSCGITEGYKFSPIKRDFQKPALISTIVTMPCVWNWRPSFAITYGMVSMALPVLTTLKAIVNFCGNLLYAAWIQAGHSCTWRHTSFHRGKRLTIMAYSLETSMTKIVPMVCEKPGDIVLKSHAFWYKAAMPPVFYT